MVFKSLISLPSLVSSTKITTSPNTVDIVPNEGFTTEEYNPANDHTDNEDLIDWGKLIY